MKDSWKLKDLKIRTGGSAIPYSLRNLIEANVTKNLYVRYAATECGAIAMAGPGEHDENERAGKPIRNVRVEIVDEHNNALPAGQTGIIRLQAPGMADGYLDSPSDSAKRFRAGWFYPGDMGDLGEDGVLTVKGRTDDMIVLNGLNIFPSEIEKVLESYPNVMAAVALGLPSRVHGQIPVAGIECRPGATVDIRDLLKYAREALALRAPRRIIELDSIPRNSQGKVVRSKVAHLFEAHDR